MRIDYIDIYKAIGIFLMVMGHVSFGKEFSQWLHSFNMPMFLFCSGYLFKPRDLKECGKYVKKLLLTYFCVGLCLYFVWKNIYNIPKENFLIFITFVNRDILPIAGPLWFLPCLSIVVAVYNILFCFTQSKKGGGFLLAISLIASCVINILGGGGHFQLMQL